MSVESSSQYIIFSKSSYFIDISCQQQFHKASRYIIFSESFHFIDISRQQQFHKAFRYMISSKSHIILYFEFITHIFRIYFELPRQKTGPRCFRIFIRLHGGPKSFIYRYFHEAVRYCIYKGTTISCIHALFWPRSLNPAPSVRRSRSLPRRRSACGGRRAGRPRWSRPSGRPEGSCA